MKRRRSKSKAQAIAEYERQRKLSEWLEWLKGVDRELDKPGRLGMWVRKWRG